MMFLIIIIIIQMQINNKNTNEKTKVLWNLQQLTLTIQNVKKENQYIILTNLLELDFSPYCSIYEKSSTDLFINLQYKIIIEEEGRKDEKIMSVIQTLKYCVLAYDKQTMTYLGLIGENGLLNYHPSIILTQNLIINSQHNIQEQTLNREITQNQIQLNPSDKNQSKDSNQDTEQLLEKSFVQPYLNQQIQIQEYTLYVTKMQKQVENLFRNYMFHEIVWKDNETQVILKRINLNFGYYDAVIQKRKYMEFKFKKEKNDLFFKNRYDSINKEIFIPNYNKKQIENKIINYYIISKQPFLPLQQEICKLFVLPYQSQIIDFLQEDPWIIVAASKYVIFLHNYYPMQYFKHQQNICATKVAKHPEKKNIIVIIDKRGSLFYYSLQQNSVTLNAIYYVPFLSPYSFLHMKDSIVMGGIDYEQRKGVVNRNKIENIRFLYIINPQIKKEPKNKTKFLAYQRKLQIINIKPEQNHIPLMNLQSTTQKQVLACTWNNKFYLVSIRGFKLIQVQLKANISKIMQIPFLFNRLNFMLLISNGQIIRVGIQSYGQCLGAQLSKLNHDQVGDFSFYWNQKSKFQLLVCKDNTINKISYLNQQKHSIIKENTGKIVKVECNKAGISYLLDLQHSVEIKYLQF